MLSKALTIVSISTLIAAMAPAAGQAPAALSPGAAEEVALIAQSCPTFSWAGVEGATGYELVLYRVQAGAAGMVIPEHEDPLLWVKLPGTASSWTPGLGDCLEVEGAYAWSVRAVGVAEEPWSEAALFEVVSAEALSEVETAVERLLERRLSALGLEAGKLPAGLVGELRAAPGSGEVRLVPRSSHVSGPTALGPGFLATTGKDPLELHVAGFRAVRYEPAEVPEGQATAGEIRPNVIGGSDLNWVADERFGATIAGGGGHGLDDDSIGDPWPNRVTGDFGTVGGGADNLAGDEDPSSSRQFATVGGGQGNQASGSRSTVGGGEDNQASSSRSTVGGGSDNQASGLGSTVGGGQSNQASAGWSTVGGGRDNQASGSRSTVGGGEDNQASGGASTVGGGEENEASGGESTVGGGEGNQASGAWSTVPGGRSNTAGGNFSFAAGRRANAAHFGAFVWADGSTQFSDFDSAAADEFAVRATGGFRMWTSTDGSTGCELTSSDSSWVCVSDREAKADLLAVEAGEALEQVAGLPLYTWRYRGADPSIRNLGPMAQDFHAAFGLGADETRLGALNVAGVALAAVQGLHEQIEQQAAENAELRRSNEDLRRALEALESRLEALER